jgi:hypothetical protein
MSYNILTNRLYVTIYLRENDLGILASKAGQIERAERIADKLGIETNYEIDDYVGYLVFHVGTQRLEEIVRALRDAGIRLGSLEVYDTAAFPIAETLGLEHEDLVDLVAN